MWRPHSWQWAVLKLGAGAADVGQQLDDGVLSDARDANGPADAVAVYEAAKDLGALGGVELVHVDRYA
jgi:hypothetical protein